VNLAGKLVSDDIVVWCPFYRKCPGNTRFWSVCEHRTDLVFNIAHRVLRQGYGQDDLGLESQEG